MTDSTIKPDPIDELCHEVVHDLARLQVLDGEASQAKTALREHISKVVDNFRKIARDCPYAGKPGCVCKKVSDAFENHRNNKAGRKQ